MEIWILFHHFLSEIRRMLMESFPFIFHEHPQFGGKFNEYFMQELPHLHNKMKNFHVHKTLLLLTTWDLRYSFFFKKAPVMDENSLTHDSKLKNCRLRMTLCRQQLELLALEFSSKRFAAPWLKINKNFSNFKRIPQETFFLFPDRCEMGTIYINHHLSFRNSLLPPFRAKHDSMLGEFLHKTNLSHQLHQT